MSNGSSGSKRYSHIDVTYDYSSPVLKKAIKPLLSETCPSAFKYYPILSTNHLIFEPYCDKCLGMKGSQEKEYNLHLFQLHNYPCPNNHCALIFVEPKHLRKHIQICEASLLLTQPRHIREDRVNINLINFPRQTHKNENENVWIVCYFDASYCAKKLNHANYGTNGAYIDPKNCAPIPKEQCYFYSSKPKQKHINHEIEIARTNQLSNGKKKSSCPGQNKKSENNKKAKKKDKKKTQKRKSIYSNPLNKRQRLSEIQNIGNDSHNIGSPPSSNNNQSQTKFPCNCEYCPNYSAPTRRSLYEHKRGKSHCFESQKSPGKTYYLVPGYACGNCKLWKCKKTRATNCCKKKNGSVPSQKKYFY